jgi:DNA-binding transcriptional ArsR family regulator
MAGDDGTGRPAWVSWVNEVDLLILEFLEQASRSSESPPAVPVGPIYHNIVDLRGQSEKTRSTFSRRCSHLEDLGMLEDAGVSKTPYYRITEAGCRYIRGEMDRDEVPRPDDA